MVKIRSISVLTYAVFCYIIFSSTVMLARAGINCSNLKSVCPNRPVVLTCKAPRLPVQWQNKNSTPKLFQDIVLRGNSIEGNKKYDDGFVATVVKITDGFVLTSLEFFPKCSYEHHGKIRCEYRNRNNNMAENKSCILHYEYIKKPLAPIDFKIDFNRYGTITLSWKYDNNGIVEHAYLSVQQLSDEDTHLGETYIVDGRNNYTVTGIQADTTYTFFLRVENCMGYNEIKKTVKIASYSPTTPEFDICTIMYSNVSSNMSTLNVEVNWQCSSQGQNTDFYKVKVIGENDELLHQEHFATSCGRSYFILPYEGMFTLEVSALNVYGESPPKSKKLIYSSSFLRVDDFLNINMTVQCCVEDKLSRNANCTIIIKEGKIYQTDMFDQQKCVSIKIPETLHHHDNPFNEAFIDGDPNICYKIIYNGTGGAMEQKGCEKSEIKYVVIISVLAVLWVIVVMVIIYHHFAKKLIKKVLKKH